MSFYKMNLDIYGKNLSVDSRQMNHDICAIKRRIEIEWFIQRCHSSLRLLQRRKEKPMTQGHEIEAR